MRYSNTDYFVKDCEFLLSVAVNTVKTNSVRLSKSSADRIREINKVLLELSNDDL